MSRISRINPPKPGDCFLEPTARPPPNKPSRKWPPTQAELDEQEYELDMAMKRKNPRHVTFAEGRQMWLDIECCKIDTPYDR